MNEQQIQAYLGQWYDIIGQQRGGGHGGGMGHQRHRRRWGQDGQDGGYDPYAYGGDGGGDTSAVYLQQLQQQLWQLQRQLQSQQVPMPMQMPVPGPGPGGPPGVSGWVGADMMPPGAFPGWPPRAAVVDAPLPTQANRDILPMSTGVPILPTQSAQITGRPQVLVFKIGRFVISNAGTAGGSADWIVNDIKIGNVSQFVQSGDVPGDMFATNAVNTFVRFSPAQTAMDVVVVVTYIGLNESGCPFFGAMVGTAAV
jgi:hypothetical protein